MNHARDIADVRQFIRPEKPIEEVVKELRGIVALFSAGNLNVRTAILQAEWVPNPFTYQGKQDSDIHTLAGLFAASSCENAEEREHIRQRVADILAPIAAGDQPLVLTCWNCHKSPARCQCCPIVRGGTECTDAHIPLDDMEEISDER